MSDRFEMRFAGSGGQGVILAAVIMGEAAALHEDGLHAVQSQAYGPEARGGSCKAEVVISKGEIDYLKAASPDLQVILTQKACNDYAASGKPGGIVILDNTFVTDLPDLDAEVYHLPIVKTAREKLGRELVTNMIALGIAAFVLEKNGMIKPESIKAAILNRVPKGTEELNSKAFDEGYGMLKQSC